jgi:hypothetical protein
MSEDCPETDIEFDVRGSPVPRNLVASDEVMAPVLRSAGYEPDEFREMVTEMAWNLATP